MLLFLFTRSWHLAFIRKFATARIYSPPACSAGSTSLDSLRYQGSAVPRISRTALSQSTISSISHILQISFQFIHIAGNHTGVEFFLVVQMQEPGDLERTSDQVLNV